MGQQELHRTVLERLALELVVGRVLVRRAGREPAAADRQRTLAERRPEAARAPHRQAGGLVDLEREGAARIANRKGGELRGQQPIEVEDHFRGIDLEGAARPWIGAHVQLVERREVRIVRHRRAGVEADAIEDQVRQEPGDATRHLGTRRRTGKPHTNDDQRGSRQLVHGNSPSMLSTTTGGLSTNISSSVTRRLKLKLSGNGNRKSGAGKWGDGSRRTSGATVPGAMTDARLRSSRSVT